ncbi:unnamed protein product [Linum trigynum]|uniref:Uncharacterized protein n=1 Tax=Linum trigynum TaxID=586398 RepID=A0AAV2GSR3_9ROSI
MPTANNPYSHGANLVVVPATAFDSNETGGASGCRNCSLSVQINWFKTLIDSLHPTLPKRRAYMKKSLTLLGEIGDFDRATNGSSSSNNIIRLKHSY